MDTKCRQVKTTGNVVYTVFGCEKIGYACTEFILAIEILNCYLVLCPAHIAFKVECTTA